MQVFDERLRADTRDVFVGEPPTELISRTRPKIDDAIALPGAEGVPTGMYAGVLICIVVLVIPCISTRLFQSSYTAALLKGSVPHGQGSVPTQ
jgi:hypothetical protein